MHSQRMVIRRRMFSLRNRCREILELTHQLLRKKAGRFVVCICSVIGLAGVTLAWFYPFRLGALGFDDIGAYAAATDTRTSWLNRTVLDLSANRWRPFFNTFFTVEAGLFRGHYEAYFWLNVVLTFAAAIIVYRIVLALTAGLWIAVSQCTPNDHESLLLLSSNSGPWTCGIARSLAPPGDCPHGRQV